MKKIRLNDALNNIDNELLERAINADSREKLDTLKKTTHNKNYLKWLSISLATVMVLIIGVNYLTKGTNTLDNNKIIQTQDKYLSANYTVEIYKSLEEYIDKNTNINNLEVGDELIIKNSDIITNSDKKFKYCKGEVQVKKLENEMFEYTLNSTCENKSDKDINLSIKLYTNLKYKNNIYQMITKIKENKDGYIGILSGYEIYKEDNGTIIYSTNEDYGIIEFDKNFSIISTKKFDVVSKGQYTITTNYGYLLHQDVEEEKNLSYYDNDLNLIWKKDYKGNPLGIHIKETEDKFIFLDIYHNVVSVDKKTGDFDTLFTINANNNSPLFYRDNLIYFSNNKKLNKYDLNGNLITSINLNNYVKFGDVSYDKLLVMDNDYAYVLDNNGEIITKVNLLNMSLKEVYLTDEYFEIEYFNKVDKVTIVRYDYKGNIIYRNTVTLNKDILNIFGIDFNEEIDKIYDFDDKFVETIYSDKFNGSQAIFVFDI